LDELANKFDDPFGPPKKNDPNVKGKKELISDTQRLNYYLDLYESYQVLHRLANSNQHSVAKHIQTLKRGNEDESDL